MADLTAGKVFVGFDGASDGDMVMIGHLADGGFHVTHPEQPEPFTKDKLIDLQRTINLNFKIAAENMRSLALLYGESLVQFELRNDPDFNAVMPMSELLATERAFEIDHSEAL